MAKTLVTFKGIPIQIGRELGKGGEGSVFEVQALANQVAKLYHQLPDVNKQAKLAFMANTTDEQLLNYVAWPQETLHSSRDGPVVGFLMPKVVGKDPVHMIYSPAHRRQDRPKAAWDFLLFVARNTAASFEALHAHGHVLGDVNQGNVMVGGDSKVVLIDSDSFQVNANGTMHLCEVGVAHFTPPELQGLTSFHGFTRTTNHDNFGLALLIFHLLFGGRHPYSGVPLRSGVGDALETDIKEFRYAYATDAATRGISPPPRSIPMSLVPPSLAAMFQMAFTERGVTEERPTAKQWEVALDSLRNRLKKCGTSSVHVYPDHLAKCPWCAIEQQGVFYFIELGATYTSARDGFNLNQVWAQIEAVAAPPPIAMPIMQSIPVVPTSLPANIPGIKSVVFIRLLALGGLLSAYSVHWTQWTYWIPMVLGAPFLWFVAGSARAKERLRRKSAVEEARAAFETMVDRLKSEAGPEKFFEFKETLKKFKGRLQDLPLLETAELAALKVTAQVRQKQKYLERFFIDAADISGVGPARKAALRSFGIETAADVTRESVLQIKGFGETRTRAVTDWKDSIESRFVFNPATAVTEMDRNAVKAKFGARKSAIATALIKGVTDLQLFKQTAALRASSLQPQLEQLAKQLAQAEIDLSLI